MSSSIGHRTWLVFTAVAALTLGACSNSSPSSGSAGSAGRRGVEAAKGGADASSIDACRLLSKNEIQQQLGVAVDDGKLQTTSSQASCDWKSTGPNEVGLGVTVKDFDQSLWSTFTSSPRAVPVSGLGEAAFAHVPTAVALMIKQSKYEIDVGVVDFKKSNDLVISDAKALAALILPRVSGSANGAR